MLSGLLERVIGAITNRLASDSDLQAKGRKSGLVIDTLIDSWTLIARPEP
jgi:hypothetical protein